MAYQFYAFQHHRKADLIAKAIRDSELTRRTANEMTLEELSKRVNEPYVAMRMMPKPSHRRPLPVRKWIVPREFKVFIVMSDPYAKMYRQWETEAENACVTDGVEEEEDFYTKIEQLSHASEKCPKMKWFQTFVQKNPTGKKIVFVPPEKWRSVRAKFETVPHAVWHPRGSRRALSKFIQGAGDFPNVLVVPSNDPPYDELPDCTWIHFRPDLSHRRCASEHYYLNVVKPEEKAWVDQETEANEDETPPRYSLDWYRWQRELERA